MSGFKFLKKLKTYARNIWRHQKIKIDKTHRAFYSNQHQLTSTTSIDRYPTLFAEAQRALLQEVSSSLKILSYGCSTGEECFSLKSYFPEAQIIGADINKRNLEKAEKKNSSNRIKFIYSSPENLLAMGPFHAIFCLSVLCRWEDTKDLSNCEKIYPFIKFNETVEQLKELLQPRGILVIYNSNFCFEDTSSFSEFEALNTPSITNSGFVHKFDRNNFRFMGDHRTCIYRKREA